MKSGLFLPILVLSGVAVSYGYLRYWKKYYCKRTKLHLLIIILLSEMMSCSCLQYMDKRIMLFMMDQRNFFFIEGCCKQTTLIWNWKFEIVAQLIRASLLPRNLFSNQIIIFRHRKEYFHISLDPKYCLFSWQVILERQSISLNLWELDLPSIMINNHEAWALCLVC